MPFVWIYRGRWPVMERIQVFTEDEADQAVREGWGQRMEGLDGNQVVPFSDVPHAASDAFYASRMAGSRRNRPAEQPPAESSEPASAGGLYGTREMRAATPKGKPIPPKKKAH